MNKFFRNEMRKMRQETKQRIVEVIKMYATGCISFKLKFEIIWQITVQKRRKAHFKKT